VIYARVNAREARLAGGEIEHTPEAASDAQGVDALIKTRP